MKHIYIATFAAILLAFAQLSEARPKYFFKIASLAPEGSVWTKHFRDFADEVEEKSNGEIGIKLYPGGVMGDDLAMLRKMRAGQLQGGGFTMTGISSVVPDFRAMAVPFYFESYEEIDRVSEHMFPYFSRKFKENGLEFISLTEVGLIYAFSPSPIATINDLKAKKPWTPSGDPVTATFLQSMGISPVQLAIPDVLSSLSTGLIDTVFVPFYGAIVMQWFTKANYLADVPYGYAYGAIAFSGKAFDELPENYAKLIHEAANKHFAALNSDIRKSNEESKEVLQQYGVTLISTQPETILQLKKARDTTIKTLKGKAFSEEAFAEVSGVMDKLRSTEK